MVRVATKGAELLHWRVPVPRSLPDIVLASTSLIHNLRSGVTALNKSLVITLHFDDDDDEKQIQRHRHGLFHYQLRSKHPHDTEDRIYTLGPRSKSCVY